MAQVKTKECDNCGATFPMPKGRGGGNQRFCCVKCKNGYHNRKKENPAAVICEQCGKARTLKNPQLAGRICRKCAAENGSTIAQRVNTQPIEQRFMKHVRKTESGCWEWAGTLQKNGYSAFGVKGKTLRGHRWAYERFVGLIPEGKQIDHLCRNRKCVNPAHLEPVTAKENSRRAMRSHCVNGHEFTEENVYLHDGKRHCRECRRARNRDFYRRKINAEA